VEITDICCGLFGTLVPTVSNSEGQVIIIIINCISMESVVMAIRPTAKYTK
jgi:hypothetical protein